MVHIHQDGNNEDDIDARGIRRNEMNSRSGIGGIKRSLRPFLEMLRSIITGKLPDRTIKEGIVHDSSVESVSAQKKGLPNALTQRLRTLQRYHGGANQERMAYMEAHSSVTAKGLAVCAEQVSIFLTSGKLLLFISWSMC